MAKRFKEEELRKLYPDFDEMLVKLLNQHGQTYAAVQLGTTQSTISLIIKRSLRIRRVCRYELLPKKQAVNPVTTGIMAHAQEVIRSDEGRELTPQPT